METKIEKRRVETSLALLDADLAASRRLVSDLREALERRLAQAEGAEAEAEFWKDEVARLRAARPDEALLERARAFARDFVAVFEHGEPWLRGPWVARARALLAALDESVPQEPVDAQGISVNDEWLHLRREIDHLREVGAARERCIERLQKENAKLQRALRIAISEAREFADADEVKFYAQDALRKAERDNAPGKAV